MFKPDNALTTQIHATKMKERTHRNTPLGSV